MPAAKLVATTASDAVHSDLESILATEADIKKRIRKLGAEITALYGQEEIKIVSVINGAVLFTANLIRQIENPIRFDCIRISSYRNDTRTTGKPERSIWLLIWLFTCTAFV